MAIIRDAILSAVSEADRLHQQFDTKARADNGAGPDRRVRNAGARDVPVIFRPLKGLLGAFLDNPAPGIIVTTQRPLPVQRFTAAHELGHATLGHQTSMTSKILSLVRHSLREQATTCGNPGKRLRVTAARAVVADRQAYARQGWVRTG